MLLCLRSVANALRLKASAGFLEILWRLPIQIERRDALWLWQTVVPLARERHLGAYDAAYLELAKREGMHLATLDRDLQEAGNRIGVPIFQIS